jgi:hypothetical protein
MVLFNVSIGGAAGSQTQMGSRPYFFQVVFGFNFRIHRLDGVGPGLSPKSMRPFLNFKS